MSKNIQKGIKKLRDIQKWGPGCLCTIKMFAYLLFCDSSLKLRALNAFSKSSFQIATGFGGFGGFVDQHRILIILSSATMVKRWCMEISLPWIDKIL
jgi:hypothetical protein